MMPPVSVISPDLRHELAEEARYSPPGDFVEVGVYKGGSADALAQVVREQKGRTLWLFDTFEGIPYKSPWDTHEVGDFNDTSLDEVQAAIPEARCIKGIFPDSFIDVIGEIKPIALAHIDCDQYKSVLDCCIVLEQMMAPGGVMVFDDYDVLPGARKAVDEYFPGRVEFSKAGKARVRF